MNVSAIGDTPGETVSFGDCIFACARSDTKQGLWHSWEEVNTSYATRGLPICHCLLLYLCFPLLFICLRIPQPRITVIPVPHPYPETLRTYCWFHNFGIQPRDELRDRLKECAQEVVDRPKYRDERHVGQMDFGCKLESEYMVASVRSSRVINRLEWLPAYIVVSKSGKIR